MAVAAKKAPAKGGEGPVDLAGVSPTGRKIIGDCVSCKAQNVPLKDVGGLLICDKCGNKKFSKRVRQAIQDAFDKQEAFKRRQAYNSRVDIAKKALKHYSDGKIPHALKAFRDYLTTLEHHHKVEKFGLRPSLFNQKKDKGEILLIAGMYWNMAKIYDRTKGHTLQTRQCLNKFLEFSVGQPHVVISSEAVRSYIKSGSTVHKKDFSKAHQYLVSHLTKCFIATACYGAQSREVEILRRFRDEKLMKFALGHALVHCYYWLSPPIARACLNSRVLSIVVRAMVYLIIVPIRVGLKAY